MSSDNRPGGAILALKDCSFSYAGEDFIDDLSLSIGEASFIGLLGPNGSGKSTMLKMLAGILRPARGEVTLWDKPIAEFGNRDRAKLVSYLPQQLQMSMPFRVAELVAMGRYPYDRPPELTPEDAIAMVGLTEKSGELITNLSGGEYRRAFLAMTLLQGAGILLLDEPLANLDIRYQVELIRLLRGLNQQRGIAIVMALHDVNLAFQFQHLMLVKEGRLLGQGGPEDVLTEPLLNEAFDIRIRVHKHQEGSFINYNPVEEER